jgi:hypothetical protein
MAQTQPVKMSDISIPSLRDLNSAKLRSLENSPDSLESLLHSKSDPIALHRGNPPYEVYSGRHRVYLASQKGIRVIPAVFT